MKWTVEATHGATGEELVVGVEAETREEAIARATGRGLLVRDCYQAGRGFYKGVRSVAWAWCGLFLFLAVSVLLCGFGGGLATPGDSGLRSAALTGVFFLALATLGFLVARTTTDSLRRDATQSKPRGIEVVTHGKASPPPEGGPTDSDLPSDATE